MPICHFSDKSSTTRQSEAKNLECINYLPSREGELVTIIVIQNGTKCSEDELLRARPKNLVYIHVGVLEILRFALDDKFKKDLLRNCIIKSRNEGR